MSYHELRPLPRLHLLHFPLPLQGKIVYCWSSDELVNFWECEKKLSHSGFLKGHAQAGGLCLAAAGNWVSSGSADKFRYLL
ncbi:hypothetical protein CerSpe_068890 [Prunus speciosa]